MTDAVLDVLITLPPQIAVAWGFTRVLPMRRAPLFVVLNVTAVTVLNAVGERFFDVGAGLVLLAAVGFVVPLLLYRGSPLLRAVVVVAANVCDNLAVIASHAVWALLMHAPVPDDMGSYYGAVRAEAASFAVSQCVRILLTIGLFALLASAVRRHRGERFLHGGISAGFLLTQVAFMVELLIVQASFEVSAEAMAVMSLLLAGCLAADALLFDSMRRYERERSASMRAEALEQQLEASLEAYREVADEVARIGRMRHDARNQLQTVRSLAESGQVERARALVADLQRRLADDEAAPRASQGGETS